MKIKSICSCISYDMVAVPYPYTHPIRPEAIDWDAISKHESTCELAQAIRDSVAEIMQTQQTLDTVSDASTPYESV